MRYLIVVVLILFCTSIYAKRPPFRLGAKCGSGILKIVTDYSDYRQYNIEEITPVPIQFLIGLELQTKLNDCLWANVGTRFVT